MCKRRRKLALYYNKLEIKKIKHFEHFQVYIGANKTKVPRSVYESINWHNYSSATRKLLMALFDRTTLATHSLTGKPSPAFLGTDKQAKMR